MNEEMKKARGYLEEASWLLLEALQKTEEHKALLQTVRGKVMTARQFIDLALKINPSQVIIETGSSNYSYVLPSQGATQ
jgi:hypothetical protein